MKFDLPKVDFIEQSKFSTEAKTELEKFGGIKCDFETCLNVSKNILLT